MKSTWQAGLLAGVSMTIALGASAQDANQEVVQTAAAETREMDKIVVIGTGQTYSSSESTESMALLQAPITSALAVIDNLPGVDMAGYAGLEDRVDYHAWRLFQAAILSSVLSVSAELGRDSNDDEILEALRDGGQRTINQAGQQIITKQLNVQPTITVRPGYRLRVIVNKDIVLKPYGD